VVGRLTSGGYRATQWTTANQDSVLLYPSACSRSLSVVYRRLCFEPMTALQTAPLDGAHSRHTREACKRMLFEVGRWLRLNEEKGRHDVPTFRTGCRFEWGYEKALLMGKSGPRQCDDGIGRPEFAIGCSPSSLPPFETLAGERLKKGNPRGDASTSWVLGQTIQHRSPARLAGSRRLDDVGLRQDCPNLDSE
jgi:hypothetical protein